MILGGEIDIKFSWFMLSFPLPDFNVDKDKVVRIQVMPRGAFCISDKTFSITATNVAMKLHSPLKDAQASKGVALERFGEWPGEGCQTLISLICD